MFTIMFKFFNAEQIRNADAYTILHEPISSLDLMERAASQVTQWLKDKILQTQKIAIVCGMGNNGGDGLVVARQLILAEFENVEVFIIKHTETPSPDFAFNYTQLKEFSNCNITEIENYDVIPDFAKYDYIVDAILGS